MPELKTPDGKSVDLDAVKAEANSAFDAAMNTDHPEPAAPPKVERVPKADTRPRTRTKPAKDDKPRTGPKTAALSSEQRAQGVKGLAQVGAAIALMFGKATKNDAFQADAVTIASSADEMADACVQVAMADAAFAARLDRICNVGPYGALIAVGVGIVSQITRNHKPSLSIPGTVDPAELLKARDELEMASA